MRMPRTALGRGALWSVSLVVLVLVGLLIVHLTTGSAISWGIVVPGLVLMCLLGFIVSSATLTRDHHRASQAQFDREQDPYETERKRHGLS